MLCLELGRVATTRRLSCDGARSSIASAPRVDAVSSRLESAIKMQQVTRSMGMVTKGMDKVLGSMNVEAIAKVRDGEPTLVRVRVRARARLS